MTLLLGHAVSKAILRGTRCDGIEVFHPPVVNSYSADRYILATGRFIGGGLKADREKISGASFRPSRRSSPPPGRNGFKRHFSATRAIPFTGQAFSSIRPFARWMRKGKSSLENVRVAGTMLAHHDCIEEKSREGIEISTGYMAAKKALERLK